MKNTLNQSAESFPQKKINWKVIQKEMRDKNPDFREPCWDCRRIAQKLNEPI